MSQTEVVFTDGGITDYLVDFWHTVEFSRIKRAPSVRRLRHPRRGNSLTLVGLAVPIKSDSAPTGIPGFQRPAHPRSALPEQSMSVGIRCLLAVQRDEH